VAAGVAASLNYLSLVENGREALQEILRLYNFAHSTYSEKQIEGLVGLDSRRHFARVISEDGWCSRAARKWRWSSTRNSSWAAACICSPAFWSIF